MIRIFVDMDDVLTDFASAHKLAREEDPECEWPQSCVGFFQNLRPIEGAVDAVKILQVHPDVDLHILTAPSCRNPHSYTEKRLWIEAHFGYELVKRLHISPDKGLFKGDILIDDYDRGKGQENFDGLLIHFGTPGYPSWREVLAACLERAEQGEAEPS